MRIFGLAASVLLILLVGAVLVVGGRILFSAGAGLAGASSLEETFGPAGSEGFRPALLFDRNGEILLAEAAHPLAAERRWQGLDQLPATVAWATIAGIDPTFWENPGYLPAATGRLLGIGPLTGAGETPPTITELLASQTLVGAPSASSLASFLLAADIGSSYPKERVLEWFLNSADYGNLALGIDAAALVYFGKHAEDLTLAEAALLAALPAHPSFDPFDDPAAAGDLQRAVLAVMRREGMISAADEAEAQREVLSLRSEDAREAMEGLAFVELVWSELQRRIGSAAAAQGGVHVHTTLDIDLQLQAECVARTQLVRMQGGEATTVLPAADASPCVAASLLPPLRPGDSGIDHGIDSMALVVLDPASGEVLALNGPAGERRAAGTAVAPLIYLSAFARGYAPATMIVDSGEGPAGSREALGPVSLRTALASGSPTATQRLLEQIGPGVAARTLEQMGVDVSAEGLEQAGSGPGVRLIDMAAAMGILANRGIRSGVSGEESGGIGPSTILAIYTPDGQELYRSATQRRAVLSEGLAYLLNHVLSDETARAEALGEDSLLDIGRPSAVVTGLTVPASDNWTLGYTPQRVVGVWIGAQEGGSLSGVHALNGSAPIWHALMRYASRDLPAEPWPAPAEVTEVDVCDPSGFLPTPYCPRVVREVFLVGTEPTHPDALYRPFRINQETGRLATFFTPLDQVEERVYFVPPPEAEAWAQAAGLLKRPPGEYDRIQLPSGGDPEVNLSAPGFFDVVSGEVEVRGSAEGEGFASYSLHAGEGLDPRAWLQVGQTQHVPVRGGLLGRWDTAGLNSVYILRLTVVREDGSVAIAAVPLTVDNRAPEVEVVLPPQGAIFAAPADNEVPIQVEASDETALARVVIFVDGRAVATRTGTPWSVRWPPGAAGQHVIRARAYDDAGNWSDSDEVTIVVVR